jgi:hypothetical protein
MSDVNKEGRIVRYKGDGPFLFWGSAQSVQFEILIGVLYGSI